jgi:hypothetical protein
MSRALSAPMQTAVAAAVIRPCLVARLDIAGDPVTAWTGPGNFAPTGTGDTSLDGQTFVPTDSLIDLSSIMENQGIGGPVTITMAGASLNLDMLKQVIRDKRVWQGRNTWLWLALLSADESTVVANPTRIKTGVISSIVINRVGLATTVSVTIDKDLGRSRGAPFRWTDHPRIYSADTFSTYVKMLANKPAGLDASDIRPPMRFPFMGGYGGFMGFHL